EARAIVQLDLELRSEGVEDLGGHGHRAEPMGVARVGRPGERQVCEPELLHVAQALVLRAVDQRPLVGGQLDGAVDGVADVHLRKARRAEKPQAPASIRASSSGRPWYRSCG